MPIVRYLSAEKEEATDLGRVARDVLPRFHTGPEEQASFREIMELVEQAPFPVAIVEGVTKGSPMDPSPDTFLARRYQLTQVAFSPEGIEVWEVLEHHQYMAIPFNREIVPATPLYVVEKHARRYLGKNGDPPFLSIQHFYHIRYDTGEATAVQIGVDFEGIQKAMRQAGLRPDATLDDQLALWHRMDQRPFLHTEHVETGPSHIHPYGISSGQIRTVRDRLSSYLWNKGLPPHYTSQDFLSFGLATLVTPPHQRTMENVTASWMEGFTGTRIEFVDPLRPRE